MKEAQRMTYEQLTQIKQLSDMGVNPYRIARKMGIPASVARYHVRKFKSAPVFPLDLTEIPTERFKKENELLRHLNKSLFDFIAHQLEIPTSIQ